MPMVDVDILTIRTTPHIKVVVAAEHIATMDIRIITSNTITRIPEEEATVAAGEEDSTCKVQNLFVGKFCGNG